MTYNTDSQNKFGNLVAELMILRLGPSEYLRTTTHTSPLVISGVTYQPFPFERGRIRLSAAPEDNMVQVQVPLDHPIVAHYQTVPTSYDVSIEVRQGHVTAAGAATGSLGNDYPVIVMGWVGDVEINPEEGHATISVVTLGATLVSSAISRQYQLGCPFRLYGPKCGAERKFTTISVAAYTVDNNRLIFPLEWSTGTDPALYVGGVLAFGFPDKPTEYRMVFSATPTMITFGGSNRSLAGHTSLQIAEGCPHTMEGCARHNNTRRYGGFPDMPMENPVGKSLDN